VKLSLVDARGVGYNLNADYDAEDAQDAINQAIRAAFEEAAENGTHLVSIFVGTPRLES